MRRSRAVRCARWTLVLASAFGFAILGASCRGVLGIEDGYQDGVAALCSIVGRCTAESAFDCSSRIHARFDLEADEGDPWSGWLSNLGPKQCLEGCVGARRCLNDPQVCVTGACNTKEECCGFLSGRVECDAEEYTCCISKGNQCASDADCCSDSRPCSPVSFTCGGVVCRNTGETCVNSFECCSKVCRASKCADEICGEDGFACTTDDECCNGFCDRTADPMVGVCGVSACGILGSDCAADGDCCAGIVCGKLDPADATGLCSTCPTAFPDGTDCGSGMQCCSGSCDKNFYQCGKLCAPEGGDCMTNEDCCDGTCGVDNKCSVACPTACSVDTDCCSQKCIGGQCKPECNKQGTCVHDLCSIGVPLNNDCMTCDNPKDCTLNPGCIKAVCDADPYCCCTSWDSLCVAEMSQMVNDQIGPCFTPCNG